MLLPTQEDSFTPLRDRWEGKGQSETGFYLRERLWTNVGGVISTLALPFATTTVLRVRSANPFNAGVGRRRSRCGVAWRTSRLFRGRGRLCQVFRLRHPQMRETTPSSFSSTIRMPTPSHVTRCPCEKSIIAPSPSAERSQHTFAARTFCSDFIPTCTSPCSIPHTVLSSMPSEMPHWAPPTMHDRNHASVQMLGNDAQSSLPQRRS